jgi:TRAP-type C4-dicarboxylate transport system substrate-binding protein
MAAIVKIPLLAGALAAALALALAACGGGNAQRSGGAAEGKPKVLTLANANGAVDELQAFVTQVDKLSGGRLRIEVANEWRHGDKHYEQGLFEDVKAGKTDLGWVGSRVLDNVGVTAFDPLHAPFLVDSYEVEDQATSGVIAQRMLDALEPSGVTGVAVLPGPMRFLQVNRAVDGPAGMAGLKIALQDSPLGEATLKALGAEPVEIYSGEPLRGLDGVESQIDSTAGNLYYETAKYTVGDLPLWPRPFVVFANTKAWDDLSTGDQGLIRRAADQARGEMLVRTVATEQASLARMCRAGAKVVALGASGRARMQAAVAPLMDKLRNNPATRESMAAIESLRTGEPPHVLSCPGSTSTPSTQQATLTGAFTTVLHKSEPGSDAIARDWGEAGGAVAIPLDLELADGRAMITEHYPSGPVPAFDMEYSVFKDLIRFRSDPGRSDPEFTARWRLEGNKLVVTDVVGGAADTYVWSRTWIKAP